MVEQVDGRDRRFPHSHSTDLIGFDQRDAMVTGFENLRKDSRRHPASRSSTKDYEVAYRFVHCAALVMPPDVTGVLYSSKSLCHSLQEKNREARQTSRVSQYGPVCGKGAECRKPIGMSEFHPDAGFNSPV
jgi:hypothetical protein